MSVSRETKVQRYIDLLVRWNRTVNLSSHGTGNTVGFKAHIEDSLTLVDHLPAGLDRIIDLGSGQGFPAIPVAIATGICIELIEADRRKAAFLTTALATLGLAGHVVCARIEQAAVQRADCVTARALAPLAKLVDMAARFVTPGGCCLFLKGPAVADEIAAMRPDADVQVSIIPTGSSRSNLVKITGLS